MDNSDRKLWKLWAGLLLITVVALPCLVRKEEFVSMPLISARGCSAPPEEGHSKWLLVSKKTAQIPWNVLLFYGEADFLGVGVSPDELGPARITQPRDTQLYAVQ